MTTEVGLIDTIHEIVNEEGEALVAHQQTQDFPQDLHTHDSKYPAPSQGEVVEGPRGTTASLQVVSSLELPMATAASEGSDSTKALFSAAAAAPKVPADEMAKLLRRYCVLTDHEVDAIVLWLISSYVIDAFRIFPKLALISPEKRCGKTTTMEAIQSMAKEGVLASNISGAAIYRITEGLQPTLMIDEADTFLKTGEHELVGLINSSHTKAAAMVVRCVGENYQAKPFSTWMPMVLASIGELPPTIMDRSIVITLRRKKGHEQTELMPVDLLVLQKPLRQRIEHWCKVNEPAIRKSLAKPPQVGNDRAADNWAPLFSVAKTIGGVWLSRCETAYRSLTATAELELPTQLLMDIRTFFQGYGEARVASATLVEELCKDSTGPWRTCSNGGRLTPHQLANLLNPYGIKPKNFRFGEKTHRGYEKDQFVDAFERYLPS